MIEQFNEPDDASDGVGEAAAGLPVFSIGDVAEATGISSDTLRMWERRYGRPVPLRVSSGHRRYTGTHVRWLRRVAEAMALGHRPRAVVSATEAELDALLAAGHGEDLDSVEVVELVNLARAFDGAQLRQRLTLGMQALGAQRFLVERVGPMLSLIGRRWANGELDVRHEHFASEVLVDFLRGARRELTSPGSGGPLVLFATLRNERHGLGLQMAALMAAIAGAQVRILGVDTPNDEIAAAAQELRARAVAVSVSLATGGVETDRVLADLRDRLDPDVRLVIGGRGARGVRRGPRGVEFLGDLQAIAGLIEAMSAAGIERN